MESPFLCHCQSRNFQNSCWLQNNGDFPCFLPLISTFSIQFFLLTFSLQNTKFNIKFKYLLNNKKNETFLRDSKTLFYRLKSLATAASVVHQKALILRLRRRITIKSLSHNLSKGDDGVADFLSFLA